MSPTSPFRAFFAAPLAPPVATALECAVGPVCEELEAQHPGGRWRPTPAPLLHLTLRFLGDTDPALRPALAEALRRAGDGVPSFSVVFRGWHRFPGDRDPRVLALGVHEVDAPSLAHTGLPRADATDLSEPPGTLPAPRLQGLAAALEASARALGFPPEPRPFLPHVTVARRRPGGGRGRERRSPTGSARAERGGVVRSGGGGRGGGSRGGGSRGGGSRGGGGGRGGDGTVYPPASSLPAADPAVGLAAITRIALYRSTLHPDGPVYEVLEEALLT